MSSVDSYADKYSRKNEHSKEHRQILTNKQPITQVQHQLEIGTELAAKANRIEVLQLSEKVVELENKVLSLTNIVKLVQKYTESQDIQYEKQKQNLLGIEALLNASIAEQSQLRIRQQNKMSDIQKMYERVKDECQSIRKIKQSGINGLSQANLKALIEQSILKNQNKFTNHQNINLKKIEETLEKNNDKLRMELNRKIQICMQEIQNIPSKNQLKKTLQEVQKKYQKSVWSNVSDQVAINREIQTIKGTLETLVSERGTQIKPAKSIQKNIQLQKYVEKDEFYHFKDQIQNQFRTIVEKFSKVVKKYVGKSISPPKKMIHQAEANKQTRRRQQETIQYQTIQNIHPNIEKRRPRSKSNSKLSKQKKNKKSQSHSQRSGKSKSISKHSEQGGLRPHQTHEPSLASKASDKRKIKQQQLKEVIKRTKQQKKKIFGQQPKRML